VHGNIKWWNENKGYGFVTADDGQDVFVHFSQVTAGLRLEDGMRVKFDVKPGAQGPQATHVGAAAADSDADGARSSAPRPSLSGSADSGTPQERKSTARANREWRMNGWER
jgi:cold shock protein